MSEQIEQYMHDLITCLITLKVVLENIDKISIV